MLLHGDGTAAVDDGAARGARENGAPGRTEPDEKPSLKRKQVFSDV